MTMGKCLAVAVLAVAVSAWTSCSGGEKSSLMTNGGCGEKKDCCAEKVAAAKEPDSFCADKKGAPAAPAKSCCTEKKVTDAAKAADGCCGFCGTGKADAAPAAKKDGFCPCGEKKQAPAGVPSNR